MFSEISNMSNIAINNLSEKEKFLNLISIVIKIRNKFNQGDKDNCILKRI
jgi:hypothetical protein